MGAGLGAGMDMGLRTGQSVCYRSGCWCGDIRGYWRGYRYECCGYRCMHIGKCWCEIYVIESM